MPAKQEFKPYQRLLLFSWAKINKYLKVSKTEDNNNASLCHLPQILIDEGMQSVVWIGLKLEVSMTRTLGQLLEWTEVIIETYVKYTTVRVTKHDVTSFQNQTSCLSFIY